MPAEPGTTGATLQTVYEGIASATRGGDKTEPPCLKAVSSVVRPVLRNFGLGRQSSTEARRSKGVLKGTGEKDKAALKTLSHTVRTVIQVTVLTGRRGRSVGACPGGDRRHAPGRLHPSSACLAVSRARLSKKPIRSGGTAAEKVRETEEEGNRWRPHPDPRPEPRVTTAISPGTRVQCPWSRPDPHPPSTIDNP
jgi:hypothetical protein